MVQVQISESGAANEANSDVPSLLKDVMTWVETDPKGELCYTCVEGHSEVTCQELLRRRLPPGTSWKTLSAEFNLPISTLSSFYQQQCIPQLHKFSKAEGYLY